MGFRLRPSEAMQLVDMMDTSGSGKVRRSAFAASQIDWQHLQQNDMQAWIEIAKKAFKSLDKDKDGVLSTDEIVASLRAKLPEDELRATLDQVMAEAGASAEDAGLDFDSFLHMLRVGSIDSLDQYDPRVALASGSSVDRLQSLLDASHHSSDGSSHGPGRGGGSSGGSAGRGLFAAGAAAAAPVAPLQDYKDKSWNKPPPNFRFDFGGGFDGGAAEGDGAAHHQGQGAGAEEPKGTGEEAPARAWPGLTTGSPELGVQLPPPQLRPMQLPANGAVRGGGHFDKRMHGASLYRNQLLAPNHHPAAAGLAPVKE